MYKVNKIVTHKSIFELCTTNNIFLHTIPLNYIRLSSSHFSILPTSRNFRNIRMKSVLIIGNWKFRLKVKPTLLRYLFLLLFNHLQKYKPIRSALPFSHRNVFFFRDQQIFRKYFISEKKLKPLWLQFKEYEITFSETTNRPKKIKCSVSIRAHTYMLYCPVVTYTRCAYVHVTDRRGIFRCFKGNSTRGKIKSANVFFVRTAVLDFTIVVIVGFVFLLFFITLTFYRWRRDVVLEAYCILLSKPLTRVTVAVTLMVHGPVVSSQLYDYYFTEIFMVARLVPHGAFTFWQRFQAFREHESMYDEPLLVSTLCSSSLF